MKEFVDLLDKLEIKEIEVTKVKKETWDKKEILGYRDRKVF